jgi:hypothetical protein
MPRRRQNMKSIEIILRRKCSIMIIVINMYNKDLKKNLHQFNKKSYKNNNREEGIKNNMKMKMRKITD